MNIAYSVPSNAPGVKIAITLSEEGKLELRAVHGTSLACLQSQSQTPEFNENHLPAATLAQTGRVKLPFRGNASDTEEKEGVVFVFPTRLGLA